MTKEEWNQSIANYRKTLLAIIIPEDIEPGLGKHILSQLDQIYGPIRIEYGKISKQYKEIENWIYRIENKGRIDGKNDSDRKALGIKAVENFTNSAGEKMNLFEIFNELSKKKEDLDALLDIIKSKNSLVITMSGLLKIEANFAGR